MHNGSQHNMTWPASVRERSTHLNTTLSAWQTLEQRKQGIVAELDGYHLHIADVVAAAYHDVIPVLSSNPEVLEKVQKSVTTLAHGLKKGWCVYGVNTGFGGNADTRTQDLVALQSALMQLTQAGMLTSSEDQHLYSISNAMPASWVRATMVVRINATVRAHSAVSLKILQAVEQLLQNRVTPVIPLRGTVSSSGDLMPLAYIVGAIEGNPDILVELSNVPHKPILPACEALQRLNLEPVRLGPKDGLGLVNGTAASAALGALVIYKANQQAVLVQALTAMVVEALQGSVVSFHPFISAVRPHPGQIESAGTILCFLKDSQLAQPASDPKVQRPGGLIQDRYSIRSAPQWIGPQLEDLVLAEQQVTTELNSSCDNPLIDSNGEGAIYNGANFQATSITSAVEKARLSLQMFGRLLFSQLTEMVDPSLSGGLTPNLVADDPNLSFTFKGVDIATASYMAELSYLANPMSSHVQAAEMHNQSVNSMAFASARYSMQAVEILDLMCANHLYASCQALDLRVLHNLFVQAVQSSLIELILAHFAPKLGCKKRNRLLTTVKEQIAASWKSSAKADVTDRCSQLITSLTPLLVEYMTSVPDCLSKLGKFQTEAQAVVLNIWTQSKQDFCLAPPTEQYLGAGTRVLYRFVRHSLQIPFHRGFVEHPTVFNDTLDGRPKKTVGSWLSIILAAINNGSLASALMEFVQSSAPAI